MNRPATSSSTSVIVLPAPLTRSVSASARVPQKPKNTERFARAGSEIIAEARIGLFVSGCQQTGVVMAARCVTSFVVVSRDPGPPGMPTSPESASAMPSPRTSNPPAVRTFAAVLASGTTSPKNDSSRTT